MCSTLEGCVQGCAINGVFIPAEITFSSTTSVPITITPKSAPATIVTEADVERWLRAVPNAVIELLPASPERSNIRALQHEVARLARELIGADR